MKISQVLIINSRLIRHSHTSENKSIVAQTSTITLMNPMQPQFQGQIILQIALWAGRVGNPLKKDYVALMDVAQSSETKLYTGLTSLMYSMLISLKGKSNPNTQKNISILVHVRSSESTDDRGLGTLAMKLLKIMKILQKEIYI